MTEKNPFKKDDGFIEILKNNPKIKDLSESNYKQFIQKNSMSNETQPTTSTYLKLVHFITKNAFVSTIVMLLVVGTLGVSAAQVFAPEENKPSTLLGGKKSSSSSSSQSSSSTTNNITSLYKGRINNDFDGQEVEVTLDFGTQITDTFTGKIRYLNSNAIFDLKGKYDSVNGFGCLIVEQYADIKLSATLSTCGNPQAIISRDDYFSNNYNVLIGKYIMADPNKSYDFKLVKVGYEEKVSSSSSSSQSSSAASSEPGLVADNGSTVETLEKCGLSFRFNKTVQRQSTFELSRSIINYSDIFSRLINPIENVKYYGNEGSGPGAGFSISCFEGETNASAFNMGFSEKETGRMFYMPNPALGTNKYEYPDKSTFCNNLSLTSESCAKGISNIAVVTVPQADGGSLYYHFTYNGKTFVIERGLYGRPGESLTLQFAGVKSASNLQTYTNPYFPNFKLVYPDSWKFETTTQTSAYDGLLKREITLTKNQYQIKLNTIPNDNYDSCKYGTIKPPFEMNNEKFANGISKFTLTQNNKKYIVYGGNKGIGCRENKILLTNLKTSQYPKYSQTIQSLAFIDNKEFVSYSVDITVSSDSGKTDLVSSNDPIISEVDQIISQSSFN